MSTRQTITVGRHRFRVGPWQADPAIAHLAVGPGVGSVAGDALATCLERIGSLGYTSVITSAMDAGDSVVFTSSGFVEHDRLHVLAHDLVGLDELRDESPGIRLRRGRRSDRSAALAIDRMAFPPFWRLDEAGLADAESATPQSRFRIAVAGTTPIGYAVTGRGGRQGFLQRLATHPDHVRRGVGSALVVDGLRWCARRGCAQVFVNTQVGNHAALALYDRLGFHPTPSDLVVMLRAHV
jgi:GNAT superfamily N-acetyltransferase